MAVRSHLAWDSTFPGLGMIMVAISVDMYSSGVFFTCMTMDSHV